ncbi:MAG: 50S ribosomal protein L21 [Minisyncoccia bacterium]
MTTGGKQYRVSVGDTVKIEKLPGEFKTGDKIVFDQVLLVDDGTKTEVGTPYLAGKTVESEFARAGRNKTINVIKYKQKSRYFKKNGHRQPFIEVKITGIK